MVDDEKLEEKLIIRITCTLCIIMLGLLFSLVFDSCSEISVESVQKEAIHRGHATYDNKGSFVWLKDAEEEKDED